MDPTRIASVYSAVTVTASFAQVNLALMSLAPLIFECNVRCVRVAGRVFTE